MVATLIDGYGTLAEWCWLIAAILFVVAGFVSFVDPRLTAPADRPPMAPTVGALTVAGLALVSLGLLIV